MKFKSQPFLLSELFQVHITSYLTNIREDAEIGPIAYFYVNLMAVSKDTNTTSNYETIK